MLRTSILLMLSSLLFAATCQAQPADAERPLNALPERTFEQHLFEIAFYVGISLPEIPVEGRDPGVGSEPSVDADAERAR